jgi:hypothetical protein
MQCNNILDHFLKDRKGYRVLRESAGSRNALATYLLPGFLDIMTPPNGLDDSKQYIQRHDSIPQCNSRL